MTTIIGLDLGKFNSAACTLLTGDGEVRFQSLPTRIAALRQLFEREQPDLVVFEACAQAGFTADLCRELDLKFLVANTNGEAWKWKNVKRKTDRDDAMKLARLAYLGELPTVELPETATRQRRAFLNFRQLLVSQRVQLQNHLRSVLVAQGLEAPRGHHAWTAAGLAFFDGLARAPQECAADELWRGQLYGALTLYRSVVVQLNGVEAKLDALVRDDAPSQRLLSVPGVGPRTAETIAAYVDRPQRFKNSRQVSAYAGLVPRQYQSGQTDRRGRITRRGPRLLRKMLVEAARHRQQSAARASIHCVKGGPWHFGQVSVVTRVIGDPPIRAPVAGFHVIAEHRSAALDDGAEHFGRLGPSEVHAFLVGSTAEEFSVDDNAWWATSSFNGL